jgi:hypothetical protein
MVEAGTDIVAIAQLAPVVSSPDTTVTRFVQFSSLR